MHRRTLAILLAGLTLDLLSMNAWGYAPFAVPAYLLVVLVVAVGALWDLRIGVAAVLLELLWGSFGQLLVLEVGEVTLSLRMGIFAVMLIASAWHLRTRVAREQLVCTVTSHPTRWAVAAFALSLILGVILGVARHPFPLVFQDANAWLFLALLPAFVLATRGGTTWLAETVLAGALFLILRTAALLFLFTHDLGGLWIALYQWVRDTRLGEVTVFPGGFPRIFLQSMVWLFPALLVALGTIQQAERRGHLMRYAVFGGSVTVLLLSLSRSFWVGLAALAGIGALWLLWPPTIRKRAAFIRTHTRSIKSGAASIAIGLLVALVLVRIPYPHPLTTAGFGATFAARFQQDEAVGNRWQQIGPLATAMRAHAIFGNGFGATVTYATKDPRTLAAHPDGMYTATAFEWGFLDDLLERGIVGVAFQLWFIGALIACGCSRRRRASTPFALALLALLVVHATSPYLNHPLGLGLILLLYSTTADA
ncbi:MAG: hypothetical protein Q7S96_00900 [bacterium]|nr:hypothetical protein [bacterium]